MKKAYTINHPDFVRTAGDGTLIRAILVALLMLGTVAASWSKRFPSDVENVEFITTFGKDAPASWGDDDHSQVYFVAIPKDWNAPVYIRVFDADISGQNDEKMRNSFNTKSVFSVYGGAGCYSGENCRAVNPEKGYDQGSLIDQVSVGVNAEMDNAWYTFFTLIPDEGEWVSGMNAYVFKIICEGKSGDDGNLYAFFASASDTKNTAVNGLNAFTYELCYRIKPSVGDPSHFYPFVTDNVVSVHMHSFDLDDIAQIKVNSVSTKDFSMNPSPDGYWLENMHKVSKMEHNTSIEFRVDPTSPEPNDAVVYFTNQYGVPVPFFASPIGGVPQYGYKSNQKIVYRVDETGSPGI